MFIITRKKNEAILIDGGTRITISDIQSGQVTLCVEYPEDKEIVEDKLLETTG
ncbi:MAG TPA: carbon storage regulator [Thiotrichaceae bacterium]|jgi:carbon storage regulator CsrA|nr:carbon storage regulator [Thiotrichaceae bacterium]